MSYDARRRWRGQRLGPELTRVKGGHRAASALTLARRLQRRVSLDLCHGRPAPGALRDCALLKQVLLDQNLFGHMPLAGDLADHR